VNLARAARESFAHVVCRLRGMVMKEERVPEAAVSSTRPRAAPFMAGGLGGKIGRERAS
jgi:hypothetical protein